MKTLLLLISVFILTSCANKQPLEAPLEVLHKLPEGKLFDNPPYPHMWYYRTEVHNKSDRPLRIVWFEAFTELDGDWNPKNTLRRTLDEEVFSNWYAEGDQIVDGIIPPGRVAVCDVNWFGSQEISYERVKWAYIAEDKYGNEYDIEAIIPAKAMKYKYDKSAELPTE